VSSYPEPAGVEEEKIDGLPKWKVEGDLRTLEEYGELCKDKKRLRAVKKLAKEKVASLEKFTRGPGGFGAMG